MGALSANMQCTLLVISLAIIFANASPIQESTVPEDYAMDTDLSEAVATIADMTAEGASDADCRKLTSDTVADIKNSVSSFQKEIDTVTSGEECESKGQDLVKSTREIQRKCTTTLASAKATVTKCNDHQVNFGSRVFSSLKKGQCGTFFSDQSYVTAKASHAAATTAETEATGALTVAVSSYKSSVKKASQKRHNCLCDKKAEHSNVFEASSKSRAANAKAWSRAFKILCVLDDKSKCSIPPVPTVHRGNLYSAAKDVSCMTIRI